MGKYQEIYQNSIQDPEDFWAKAAENITWHRKWDKVLDASNPPFYRWFVGGELNIPATMRLIDILKMAGGIKSL